ncbi:MAG: 3-phosphoserine/phosphohydroxythreonine transaminase [Ruminococcaceae bacterium]|nr:3-phosphoserine/phosphohydroxythreonine transaminase [Oscillospiraceae bacterium]
MNRVYNFSAGPSMLPLPVLERAQAEMLSYEGSGQSVLEMSHRSKVYDAIIVSVQEKLRKVMNIPDNYKVLFVQGGASTQFAAVPMNLMTKNKKADYIVTGQFSGKAQKEAMIYGEASIAASSKEANFTYIPSQDELKLNADADYVHICFNNTIFGSKFNYIPETGDVPLVADMSSCILSEPVDVTKYGVIYAGAQKNMAPAGLTVVIVREDLIGETLAGTPTMLKYSTMAENDSMYNTPPCYCIYMLGLVLDWIEEIGGLSEMKKINENKAKMLYDFIDESKLFSNPIRKDCRSMMNVTFVTGDKELDDKFCKEAAAAGFVNIKGHRSVGGMRASIYNAMPTEGVEKLVEFMKKFEAENAK